MGRTGQRCLPTSRRRSRRQQRPRLQDPGRAGFGGWEASGGYAPVQVLGQSSALRQLCSRNVLALTVVA
ncbi:hypothetical protein D3250_02280 [Nesterenkonia natronophila]|uniref:Uncharacterized protein n=1 Tax=Nesterenkonia natronophila TaxID=2174932 RepID=A0A3A4FJV0_9MICC|nr:hypothetical protein D3250_02280 [Nesterenkonia natronophila]